MATTFRQDVVAGLLALLDSFQAAHPTMLKRTFPVRPPSFPELPLAFVGSRDELILHDSGLRTRRMNPTIVFVDLIDLHNTATLDRLDTLIDAALDHFTANPHGVNGAVLAPTRTTSGEIAADGIFYATVEVAFEELTIAEGRS